MKKWEGKVRTLRLMETHLTGFFSLWFASFHPSNALRSAMWSLHKNVYKIIQNSFIIINILKLTSNPKMCNQCYILSVVEGRE